ncbi:response regulator transcription factor [Actinoplanes sp. NBRC 103695]|uniref:response regulator transcription factor n=1 Tax=Actinoplanes sp. NBRC 103695 TaxID=3032202 RepID=UPI0024A0E0CB|nr:response regulator transcription factor [Actinoplanes sp. NBRC 103695]GLY94019.1 DNA-binding response regulator [Actinoplanes sp. NBRC 103695]
MIQILLADDQALLRSTFRMLIDSCDDMTVVAEAANGEEAADLASRHRPDLVLMDIRMPVLDGLAATRRICSTPELARTRVLILTTFETDEYVARALEAGASGFLGKDVTPESLLAGIRTVVGGEALLSPAATRALIDRFLSAPGRTGGPPRGSLAALTDREREIAALAAHGLSNQEIAERLVVSPLTVRTHIHRAMMKVQARDRAQLVVAAYQQGLVRVR